MCVSVVISLWLFLFSIFYPIPVWVFFFFFSVLDAYLFSNERKKKHADFERKGAELEGGNSNQDILDEKNLIKKGNEVVWVSWDNPAMKEGTERGEAVSK